VNALEMLHDDHQLFRRLLADGEAASSVPAQEHLLASLGTHLSVHEQLERELLYPIVQEIDPGTVRIATEGHRAADEIVGELRAATGTRAWPGTIDSARDRLDAHLTQEEREVFHVARAVLGDDGLETLGERMWTIRDAMVR